MQRVSVNSGSVLTQVAGIPVYSVSNTECRYFLEEIQELNEYLTGRGKPELDENERNFCVHHRFDPEAIRDDISQSFSEGVFRISLIARAIDVVKGSKG